jgi:hypothetical protein
MTLAILGDAEKRWCVVTRLYLCHFEAVVQYVRPSFYVEGEFERFRVQRSEKNFHSLISAKAKAMGDRAELYFSGEKPHRLSPIFPF